MDSVAKQASVNNSRAKYEARKLKQAKYNERLALGRAYVHQNRENILFLELNSSISIGVEFVSGAGAGDSAVFAFAFRRDSDKSSFRVVKGVLGAKLSEYKDSVAMPMSVEAFGSAKAGNKNAQQFLASLAFDLLVLGILEGDVSAPIVIAEDVINKFTS